MMSRRWKSFLNFCRVKMKSEATLATTPTTESASSSREYTSEEEEEEDVSPDIATASTANDDATRRQSAEGLNRTRPPSPISVSDFLLSCRLPSPIRSGVWEAVDGLKPEKRWEEDEEGELEGDEASPSVGVLREFKGTPKDWQLRNCCSTQGRKKATSSPPDYTRRERREKKEAKPM